MGKYSWHDDPYVDTYIQKKLNLIIKYVTRLIPTIKSIVLAGGFGRGEGTVAINGRTIRLIRDFDIYLLFEKSIPWSAVRKVEKLLQQTDSFRIQNLDYGCLEKFTVNIHATTLKRWNRFLDIKTVDIKNSTTIYGENLLNRIEWSSSDIPIRSGGRILLEQSFALLSTLQSSRFISEGLPESMTEIFVRECSKTYIYLGTALCIFAGKHATSDFARIKILEKIFNLTFPGLKRVSPELPNRIAEATMHKLDPRNRVTMKTPIDYWFQVRQDLGEVIRYCYRFFYLGIQSNSWREFSEAADRALRNYFYLPLIRVSLGKMHFPWSFESLANLAFNITENLSYTVSALRRKVWAFPLCRGVSSPSIKLLVISPLVLFSVDREGRCDIENLQYANRKLSFVELPNSQKSCNLWDIVRSKILVLHRYSKIAL